VRGVGASSGPESGASSLFCRLVFALGTGQTLNDKLKSVRADETVFRGSKMFVFIEARWRMYF
jgi:hypothetical protein